MASRTLFVVVLALGLCAVAFADGMQQPAAAVEQREWKDFLQTPRNCAREMKRIHADMTVQQFYRANENCTSGVCSQQLDQMKESCMKMGAHVCTTEATFIGLDGAAASRTSYACVSYTCRVNDQSAEFHIATRMYERGYTHVSVEETCGWERNGAANMFTTWFIELCVLIGFFIFACCEKARRYRNGMRDAWPSMGTHGSMRTTLCGCCGCNANCWRATCCALPTATFNRAELDGRQWRWPDFCCMHHGVAYWNRQIIRRKLDAAPEPCCDLLKACCCHPCMVAQNSIEIEKGFAGSDGDGNNLAQPIGGEYAMTAITGAAATHV